jgi:predicted O-methyltransferase YrrM
MNNTSSDKSYWHGFDDFYETYFKNRKFNNIAEFGIFKGGSVRWLLDRFPDSKIYASDIIPRTDEWPVDDRFIDVQLDQGNVEQVKDFLNLAKYDLIIEDGSHYPEHQVSCLVEGMNVLAPGGLYILEDIHTSLDQPTGNALTVLLAIQHYRRLELEITDEIAEIISNNSLMSANEVLLLDAIIDQIILYRRTRLPDWCYRCNSFEFNYSQLRCTCGEEIFSMKDSMSFVIIKKNI